VVVTGYSIPARCAHYYPKKTSSFGAVFHVGENAYIFPAVFEIKSRRCDDIMAAIVQ
jgi:hypothetical protein